MHWHYGSSVAEAFLHDGHETLAAIASRPTIESIELID